MQMNAEAAAAMLRAAPPNVRVRIEFEGTAADLLRMVEESVPNGPENLSTRQAAERYGWTARDWARWAADKKIEGAIREGKVWRLPSASCKRIADRKMGREKRDTKPQNQQRRGGNHGRFRT